MTVRNVDKNAEARTMVITAEFKASIIHVWQLWADPRLTRAVVGSARIPGHLRASRPHAGRHDHLLHVRNHQPGWNSIDSMIGAVSATTASKRSSGATTVIARVSTDMPSGRSTR